MPMLWFQEDVVLKGPEKLGNVEELADVLGRCNGNALNRVSDLGWRPHGEHM